METLLITGAAGFIGNEACTHYRGRFHVVGVDNFQSPTAREPEGIEFHRAEAADVLDIVKPRIILHLAAQVSAVASMREPYYDFYDNAWLTLRIARWAERHGARVLYASSNKVYGALDFDSIPVADTQPISPSTPYGISKAMGGLYLRALAPQSSWDFRQSCIYGESQRGTEEQGWIGWLRSRIAEKQPITCYGDGQQVRDLLHVSDLLRVYDLALDGALAPGSYAVGGGVSNALTFSEAVALLGGSIASFEPARPRDQRIFVSRNDGLRGAGWNPLVDARKWLASQRRSVAA